MPKIVQTTEPFGKRLRELRQAKGLSQMELAAALGVTQVAISHYELGLKKPPFKNLCKLSELLDVAIDDLIHSPAESTPRAASPNNRRLQKKLRALDQLPARDQRAVANYIDALLVRHQTAVAAS